MKQIKLLLLASTLIITFNSCLDNHNSNREMVILLAAVAKTEFTATNAFCPEARVIFYDSILKLPIPNDAWGYMKMTNSTFYKARALLEVGRENESIKVLEHLLTIMNADDSSRLKSVLRELAIAYMRLGEISNCVINHGKESCVFPIKGDGIQSDKAASLKAIKTYELVLQRDPNDLESRWLMNIAYMAIGEYPKNVPDIWLIKGLGKDSSGLVKPFIDAAINTGLNTNNLAGGSIIEDFNNDNYLDIVTSSWHLGEGMHYCKNNSTGTFTNISESSGLKQLTGGLNIQQTDYNNDGFKDIFVLRGGWRGPYGKEPNSLLRNNGDGTFTDVTKESGLLSFHPTQTATWNDFNNDGWLDVFVGNESQTMADINTCELFMNNKNGTFTETALKSNANVIDFVKGVTSGDYNNDGWPDIFISTLAEKKILLQNEGIKNGQVHFKDVTQAAGLGSCHTRTFPTCFFDFDNDGWLDILVCSYEAGGTLATYAAREALHLPVGDAGKQFLFRNKHDETFEDVTDRVGLNKIAFAMGMNFGDIDNDGYLDLYLGTGNPLYQSLVPNKMFKNEGGTRFIDVTSAARVGNLQKGHGVSFADLDNDGDQDIYIDMGGAYTGDAYPNSFFINPGQSKYQWINLNLEGTKCNRAAIGAKIKVTFRENGIQRSVYRDVNSGGSFGSNPLLQHIGIGSATIVESIEIKWPVSNLVQVFKNVQPGETLKIKEGKDSFSKVVLNQVDFTVNNEGAIICSPAN